MRDGIRILFVCLGNICRSPAAEAVMRRKVRAAGLEGVIEVDSAGTYGGHAGQKADCRMRRAAGNRGYEITHRSRKIRYDDFEEFDWIVVMDDANFDAVRRLAPDPASMGRIRKMSEFFRSRISDHVPDPYYEGAEGFEYVLDLLEDGTQGLLDEIIRKDNPDT